MELVLDLCGNVNSLEIKIEKLYTLRDTPERLKEKIRLDICKKMIQMYELDNYRDFLKRKLVYKPTKEEIDLLDNKQNIIKQNTKYIIHNEKICTTR